MKISHKQKGVSLIGLVVSLVIGAIVMQQVFYLGKDLVTGSKVISLASQISKLRVDIVNDAANKMDYSHLNITASDQTYLLNAGLVPIDWKLDSVKNWFITPNGEIIRVVNGIPADMFPSNDSSYTGKSGFMIVIKKIHGSKVLDYYREFSKTFYGIRFNIDGTREILKKGNDIATTDVLNKIMSAFEAKDSQPDRVGGMALIQL